MTPPSIISAHDGLVQEIAGMFDLPLDLFRAQVMQESGGNADAFRYERYFYERYIQSNPSAKGFRYGPVAACSFGLLQILFETALEHGFIGDPWYLFDPRVGLLWGAKYLKFLWQTTGDGTEATYRLALQRYNGTGIAAIAYANSIYKRAGLA